MSSRSARTRTVRRVKRAVALGGAVATAMGCSAAVAFAGPGAPSGIVLDPTLTASGEYHFPGGYGNYLTLDGPFRVSNVYGSNAGQPAPPDAFQGSQTFTVHDANGNPIGTIDALVSHGMTSGNQNLQVLVTGVHPDSGVATGTETGQLPNIGSVFNWGGADPSNPSGVYMSLAGAPPNDITGPPVEGNVTANSGLLGWIGSLGFDGTARVDVHNALVNQTDFQLPNGDHVIADPHSAETYDSFTNTAPYATAVQGTQMFDVIDKDGELVGTFTGRTISTADLVGGHSYEILVMGNQTMADGSDGVIGTGAGQLPPDGSVFNMLYYFSPTSYSVYTDYNMHSFGAANQINQSLNVFGMHFPTTWNSTFDAVKGFTDGTNLFTSADNPTGSIPYLDLSSAGHPTVLNAGLTPHAGSELFTGINGMPNGGLSGTNAVVQGIKTFTVNDSEGSHTFNADVTTFGNGSVNDVTLYLNPDQFNYANGAAAANPLDITDTQLADLLSGHGMLIDGGSLPEGWDAGDLIEYANHGWYSTLTVTPDAVAGLHDGVTQMLSIPLLGGAWSEIPESSDWFLGLFGITF